VAFAVPQGFSLSGVHCRIKHDPRKPDLALLVSDLPAAAAGVYTKNVLRAAPVIWDSALTPGAELRAIVVCSGVANACTGKRGLSDAAETARLAAAICGARAEQVLVLSTGVIGVPPPMDKIAQGIAAAVVKLGRNEASLDSASRAMLTTDAAPKLAGRNLTIAGRETRLLGMAKGATMMGPNMATMLAVLLTDAALSPDAAQAALTAAVDDSFNCMSVDGHSSTNDTVLLLANGAAGGEPLEGEDLVAFRRALGEVCIELARQIAAEGQGVEHLITIEINGCANRKSAQRIARAVALSPLVKASIHRAEPNWGRIVSAAGMAGVAFRPDGFTLCINGIELFRHGMPVEFDAAKATASIRENRETLVQLDFSEGSAGVRFWTADALPEFVAM
jgi:glutamate N-acetyltransferase/amino-acid N-acetyltransferase